MRADYTSNPSARKHLLWASITSAHLSSPLSTIHSSRAFFVSGHEQHIFLPDLPSFGPGCAGCGAAGCSLLLPFPILLQRGLRAWSECVHEFGESSSSLRSTHSAPGTGTGTGTAVPARLLPISVPARSTAIATAHPYPAPTVRLA